MMLPEKQYPKVGIGVWLFNDSGQVLMMKRRGSHGSGTWAPPGGKLEMGESFLECARREVKEETDLDINGITVVGVTNDIHPGGLHYVTVIVKALAWTGKEKILEPEKCSEMGWYNFHHLPEPLFLSIVNIKNSDFLCPCGSGEKFKDCNGK